MAYEKQNWVDRSNATPINAKRLLHIEEGIYDAAENADTALEQSTSALVKATSAVESAEEAVSKVTEAKTLAEEAKTTAEEAKTIAAGIADTAIEAKEIATGAKSIAQSAESKAIEAITTAQSVESKADAAQEAAEEAKTTANEASDKATSAQESADAAMTKANEAQSTANLAKTTADEARIAVTLAQTTADEAKTAAALAQTTADTATTKAETAQTTAITADTKAIEALAKATKVEANPELSGEEEILNSIKIIDTKYKLGGSSLPEGSEGTALVHNGTEWVAQSGYGYFIAGTGGNVDWNGDATGKENFLIYLDGMPLTFARLYDVAKTKEELAGGSFTITGPDIVEVLNFSDDTYLNAATVKELLEIEDFPDDCFGYDTFNLPGVCIFPTAFILNEQQINPGIYAISVMQVEWISNITWGEQDTLKEIDSKFTFGKGAKSGDAHVFNGSNWDSSKDFGYSITIPMSIIKNIDWDGDTTGLTKVNNLYKVSSDIDLKGTSLNNKDIYVKKSGDETSFSNSNIDDSDTWVPIVRWSTLWIALVYQPGTYKYDNIDYTFIETGIYFLKSDDGKTMTYKMVSPEETTYTPFKEDYLGYKLKSAISNRGFGYTTPEVSGKITWDGNITEKLCIDGMYLVSTDNVYSTKALIGATAKYFDGSNTKTVMITEEMLGWEEEGIYGTIALADDINIFVVYSIYPAGIYFSKDSESGAYVSELTYTNAKYISKIDSKYLDSSGGTFYATYGTTTYAEIKAAYEAGKTVLCLYNDGETNKTIHTLVEITSSGIVFSATIYSDGLCIRDLIIDSNSNWGTTLGQAATWTETKAKLDLKQDTLIGTQITGQNIKTVNGNSLLGSGNIEVQPTLVSGTNIKTINNQSILGSGNIEIASAEGIKYTEVEPTADNTDGTLKVVVLHSEPTKKFAGWWYIILDS